MIDAYRVIAAGDPLSGNGYIAGRLSDDPAIPDGIVTVNGVPAARRVYLFDQITRRLVAETFSNTDGTYRFDGLNPDEEFAVQVTDYAGVYEDFVSTRRKPSTAPIIEPQTVSVKIGDPLSYKASVLYGIGTLTFSSTGTRPTGVSFSGGVFSAATVGGSAGSFPITVAAVDANSESASGLITIEVTV